MGNKATHMENKTETQVNMGVNEESGKSGGWTGEELTASGAACTAVQAGRDKLGRRKGAQAKGLGPIRRRR